MRAASDRDACSQVIGCAGSALTISGRLPGRSCRRCARFRSWRLPAGSRRAADGRDARLDLPGIHERGEFRQDFADRRRCKDHGPSHAVSGGCFRRRRLNERDEDAARFQHAPGALLRFTAYRVKHHIHIMHGGLEGGGGIINHFIHAQVAHKSTLREVVPITFAPRGLGELHGDVSDPAGCPVDENGLPCRQLGRLDERLPGRQEDMRERGRMEWSSDWGLATTSWPIPRHTRRRRRLGRALCECIRCRRAGKPSRRPQLLQSRRIRPTPGWQASSS